MNQFRHTCYGLALNIASDNLLELRCRSEKSDPPIAAPPFSPIYRWRRGYGLVARMTVTGRAR